MRALRFEPVVRDPICIDLDGIDAVHHPFCALQTELTDGLALYWLTAGKILVDSGIQLAAPENRLFSLEKNFFSALFLYSYYRCQIPKERRILYTAVNQCLRGMVTGCDNLLDDEYKMTLDTNLPVTGTRFRSVLDIMVSERVLFDILLVCLERGDIPLGVVRKAVLASLQALTRSGSQEAAEEAGVAELRLSPDEVLSTVHHFKTGLLFQCPWAVPAAMEKQLPVGFARVKNALYRIGIACQILDDMVDLAGDVRNRRHNYVASVIAWGNDEKLKRLLSEMAASESPELYLDAFEEPFRKAYHFAVDHLREALTRLFHENHQVFVEPSATFIAARIGADRVLHPTGRGDA
jgi:hypothetical protein